MGFFSEITQKIANMTPSGNEQTAYQSNLQTVKTPEPEQETTRSVLAKIYQVAKKDPEKAKTYYGQLLWEQEQPNSQFYNPYMKPTNQAVSNLAAYGIDTSNIDDNWFEANSWLKQFYQTTGTTNNVKSPGKKASAEENAAYQFNQIWMAEEQTKKAETEWAALQQELSYWAQRSDRNYSDEYIIGNIDWSKYKTLQKMDDTRKQGTPMELNRAVGYSEDAMYGVLWAARNNGGSGYLTADIAYSGQNTGNTWKYNPDIADKLNPESEKFSPYSIGSTNLDDAAVYFNVASFGKNWLQQNSSLAWSNDETAKKMYQQVYKAEENQTKAEDELAKLNEYVEKKLKNHNGEDGAEWILSHIDWSDYPTLAAMDKSIGVNGVPGTGDLIPMTRGLDYRYADLKQMIYDRCAENEAKGNGDQFGTAISNAVAAGITADANAVNGKNVEGMDAVSAASPIYQRTQQEMAVSKEQDKVLRNGAETVADIATPAEKAAMENVWSVTFDRVKNLFDGVKQSSLAAIQGLANSTKTKAMNDHASETLGNFQTIYNYETNQQNIEAMELELDALKTQLGDMIYAGQEMESRKGKYITINGDQFYVTLNNVYTDDGSYMLDGASFMENGDPFNVDEETMTMLENSDEVKKYIEEANREAAGIEAINQLGETLPEETLYAAQRVRELELSIEDAKEQNINHEAEYLESQKAFDDAQLKREETIHMLKALGCDTTDLEIEDSVIGYLVDFGNYEATVWNAYDPYAVYHIQLAEGEDQGNVLAQAKKDNDEVVAALEEATAVRDYLDMTGLTVPDNYRTNLDRHIAKLERDVKAYENFMISQNDDFEKAAMDGRKLAYQSDLGRPTMQWEEFDPNTDYGMHEIGAALKEQMTDVEKNIYYYLLGKGDKTGAAEYLQSLTDMSYGVLHTRYTEYLKNKAAGMVKDDFFGTNVLAVLASPLASLASLGYLGYSVISGNEINPDNALLFLNNFKTTTREESAKQIINTFGDGTVGQKLVQGFYEIVTNRLDSLVNGTTFGVFSGGIGNDILQELVGASPMGLSAAMDAMMQAKRKGATDGQAYGIGLVTFLAETGTEAISLDNIKGAFRLGEEITEDRLKGFFKNWLKRAGISEMLGESANDIIENAANEWIMGDKSDHNDLVWSYRMKGYDKEDAEAMARMDELKGVLHTALISYLSPGLDIVSYGAGRMNYYRQRTRQAQQSGDNRNIIQIINGEKAEAQQRNAENREGQIDYDALEARYGQDENQTAAQETVQAETQTAPQETNVVQPDETTGEQVEEAVPEQGPIEVINAPEEGADTVVPETVEIKVPDLEADYQALEAAMEADQASQTATVASVLDVGGSEESSDIAKAAAANIDALTGGDMSNAEFVQDLVLGAYEGEVDGALVKQAIQNAALSEDSAAYQVMQTSEYIHADLEQKAQMLAATVEADANNGDVMNQINKAVYEHQVATAEMELILNGGLKDASKAQEAADAAAAETQAAQEEYDSRQADLEAKGQNLQAANDDFQNDPANHALADMVTHALSELQKSNEVAIEYQQQLDNAKERQQKAENDAQRAKEEAMSVIRQQAEAIVNDQIRQRAERQAQEAELARQAAEQEAQQQIAQEESDNALRADADAFIADLNEKGYNLTPEEEEHVRDLFEKNKDAELIPARDENGQLTEKAKQDRDKFVKQVSDKYGIQIDVVDTAAEDGMYSNGYYDRDNNRIVLDVNSTMDDAMYFVLGHELTHVAEQSGTYTELANALLRIAYGEDADYETAISNLEKNGGRPTTTLEADILHWKDKYDRQLKKEHSYEYALQELVADNMGVLINDQDNAKRQDLVNRLVAEEPSVARRVLDSIKRFIKQAFGMKGAWLSNAQQTVDMFEAALMDAQGRENAQKGFDKKFNLSDESPHLADQIREVSDQLDQMDIVKSVSSKVDLSSYEGKAKNKEAAVKLWAKDKNKAMGKTYTREGFGTLTMSNSAISAIFSYLGYDNDAAIAAFEAVPDVFMYGIDAGVDEKHKGRPVDSYTFAAPVEVDGIRGNMGVIVHKSRNDDTFKTYKVLLPDGRELVVKNEKTELAPEAGSEEAARADSVSNEIISLEERVVKPAATDSDGTVLTGTMEDGTEVKNSLSSWTSDEIKKVRQNLLKNGFTQAEADKWIGDVNSIAAVIAADKDRLDFTPDRTQKFKKPNGDVYKWTLDASTLCAKRLLYQGTFNEIQKLLPNTPLYAGDLIELSNMMREMGYQTPCGICYVESQRRDTGKFTEEFLAKYSKEHEGEFIPTYADLTTSDGLYKLRDEHPEVYNAYIKANNARGSASTKPVQLRTDYRGDVRSLTADSVEYLNSIGGLRIQSFSDFETPHLMDMMQAVLDMTAKGLKSQAYTKVPNFAWVFGDTGIKINLSLMGEGTGVDENGNLIFSSTEGMDFDEAMRLRDRYSQNVGTILVGMNDAHILAAMADPRIDYIIPFHRSGWSEENRAKMTSLANYKDYQDYQNERDIKTGKKAESNLEPLGPNGYWDYNLTGKENAEKYLKLCAENGLIPKFEQFLVNNGDGSYSLQPDGSTDGYWKTLIDIKMYDNDGNGAPQQVVNPNINMEEAYRVLNEFDGTGVNSLPVAQPVVDRYVEEYKARHPIDEQSGKKYSLPSDKLLEQQIRQYLANGGSLSTNITPPGNNLPGTPGMRPQRQFGSRTAQTSNALHDEVKEYLYNHSSYTPDTNQEQVNRAMDWVRSMASENDPDGYYAALNRVTADNFDYRSADGQARMLTVMSMAALKAEAGDRGALNDELRLADAFNKQGTDLGRQLQARKIFRLMTPVGRQSVLQSMCDDINERLGRKGINTTVRLSDETLKAAGEAQTEDDFAAVRKRAAKEIAEQMPSNWKDKLRGWRMLSMLGNPRTHIRNIVGNALFVPVVSMKNKLGALGEIITRQDQRTKTLSPVLSKEVRDFAKQDALTMKDTLTGEAKYNENSLVEREQKPFKGLLQAIIDFNSNMLEKEDWTFLKGHYKRALGGWMQANGYTAEQLQNNPTLLEQGRSYAVQEAQKATYRDFSKLASTLNKVSREGGIAGFLTDAVLPFKKTPANILKRGIEYSPAGIMRSLTTDLYHLKQWNDYENGKLSVLPDKAISPNQFIDRLCSGLSGTAIMAIGALLSSAGIVTCGLDDDEDKLEKEQGNQEYSFKFNIAGQDFTFTMDWAAPMSMPFFVGAAIQEQLFGQEGFDIESLVDAFGNITEPVFNLSMLDGVNSLFKTSQYDDTNTLTQIAAKIGSNYGTSYVPSLMGAIARTVDDTRRKSFVEQGQGTGVLGTFRYAKEQVENKIPGLSQTNIPVRDVWGNADTSGLAERILENFILPGYINEYKNDPILNEMARLYDATGDANMITKDPDKSVTYKKQKHVLTAEQWDEYKTVRGQTAFNGLTELINSKDYQEANENTQVQMIKDVWSYADKVGKKAIIPGFEMEDMGANPVATVTKDAKITSYKSDMMVALASGDYEGYDTMVEALHEEGVEDSEIKNKISGVYRDKYKDAYRKGDTEQMAEIEELLDNTGFNFDLNNWEKQVDEKYNQ